MTSAAVRFTYTDYLNLPEESRYEILDGDLLMSPSPTAAHQRIVKKLALLLQTLIEDNGRGEVFVAPLDVILSDTNVVQPDLLVVSKSRAAIVKERGVFGAPDLVVEVLSASTAERDRTVKAKVYARAGVSELWIVDADARTIEILANGPGGFHRRAIAEGTTPARSSVFPEVEIRTSDVF
jgi:Uma2 family endonuclease